MLGDIISGIGDAINAILEGILSLLPDSPFQALATIPEVQAILGPLNYFIPISFALSLLQTWLFAVGLYYIWMVLLRWLKAVE
jgi:hypothetical protein